MHSKRRTELIDRLANSLIYVATDFERFGGEFLSALLLTPMDHRGVNLLGFPIAGVVDTISDDSAVAAEYSALATYFGGKMKKAEGDLKRVLAAKPSAKDIFLLASRRKAPQNAQNFERRVSAWPEMKGKALHLWGGEEIAAQIIDHLIVSETVVRRLAPYLPELRRIFDEEAASALAPPPDPRRLDRPAVDREVASRLGERGCLVLSGMGGLGKSETAAAYAAAHRDDYRLVVWLKGHEVNRVEDLHAFPLLRGGQTRNIAGILQAGSCLLVIDDAGTDINPIGVSAFCGPKSHVILTRRMATTGAFEPPMFNEAEARTSLNRDALSPCPEEVFGAIWSTVNGHPLTLGLINAAVIEGTSWTQIVADCRAVGELADKDQRLADRMLQRLRAALQQELSVFQWAGQSGIDSGFLEDVVLPLGLRKLKSHGLTAADRVGILRLHDVIFASLDSLLWWSPERATTLGDRLEAYLTTCAREPGLRFWTVANNLKRKIESLIAVGDRRPAYLYALLTVWHPSEVKPVLVGDPVKDAKELVGARSLPLAVTAIIEAIEQLFLLEKILGGDVAVTRLRDRLAAFDVLASLPGLADRQRAEIDHHKAKAMKRLGDISAAAKLFESVLAGPTPMDESRLQLAQIYRADPTKMERVGVLIGEILEDTVSGKDLSFSVFLAAVELLPWGSGTWRNKLLEQHQVQIEKVVVQAARQGVPQAYQAFASIGRYYSKESPEFFRRIFAQLPEPTVVSDDSERFAWGEILLEASRISEVDTDNLRIRALAAFDSEIDPEPYHVQRRAELLIDMGRARDGEVVLSSRNDLETSPWIQRLMARARLANSDPDEALIWIDKALANLKREDFRSEFYELRYDVRTALKDPDAIDDLQKSLEVAQTTVRRSAVEARLKDTP